MADVKWLGAQFEAEITDDLRRRAADVGEYLRAQVSRKLSRRRTRVDGAAPAGQPPGIDTGRLRNSLVSEVKQSDDEIRIRVGPTVIYGRILELGGTIMPKKAKALAVPISQKARRHRGSPRTFKGELVMIARKGKAPLLVEQKRNKTIVHYVLVPKVKIKPHPYLRPTLQESLPTIRTMLGVT